MSKILYINNNDFHNLGRSQMCAGGCYVFRPSKPHSGPLCSVLWPAGLCCVYVRSVAVTLSSAGSWDSTKLDKIGGNWHKLGLMRLGAAAVPYLGWAGAAGCSARSAPASRTSSRQRRGEAPAGWLLAPAGAPGLLSLHHWTLRNG